MIYLKCNVNAIIICLLEALFDQFVQNFHINA